MQSEEDLINDFLWLFKPTAKGNFFCQELHLTIYKNEYGSWAYIDGSDTPPAFGKNMFPKPVEVYQYLCRFGMITTADVKNIKIKRGIKL